MVIYIATETNLIDERFVPRDWIRSMRLPPVRTLTYEATHRIRVTGILLLYARIGLRVCVWFGVVPDLVTRVLLRDHLYQ